jgi:sulfonate transport system substrate-binding protein
MRVMRSAAVIFLIVLLALSTAVAQNAPVKIRVAWVVPAANWPSILFEKPEILKHLGKSYVIEPVRFQGTTPMITALGTGDLDIADLAYSSFALAIQNARMNDLRVIADEFSDGVGEYQTTEYMVLKDSPIRKVEDLKGKVLAINAVGSGVDLALRAMLRKHGLDPAKDVTIIEAAFPNMKAILAEKKADLVACVLPFQLNPELRAMARTLFTQKEAFGGPSQMILWAARDGFLKKNRAAMVDFMEDSLRAARFFLDPANHNEAVQIASKVSKLPPQAFADWYFTKKDYYRNPNLLPNLDTLQANINLQRELGFLNMNIDVKKYADLSIAQEAAKRLENSR